MFLVLLLCLFQSVEISYIMDTINFLKNIELFSFLDDQQLEKISRRIKTKTVHKKIPIIIAGDTSSNLYIIKEGSVKVAASNDDGDEIILSTLQAGEIFGELSLFDEEPRSADVIAAEDCSLLILSRPDFLELIDDNPKLAMQVIKYLCQRIRFTNKIAQSLALMDVYERLRVFLLQNASPEENGKRSINRPLSQREIAANLGCGREIVCRILKELQEGNYITINHKIITINKKLPQGR